MGVGVGELEVEQEARESCRVWVIPCRSWWTGVGPVSMLWRRVVVISFGWGVSWLEAGLGWWIGGCAPNEFLGGWGVGGSDVESRWAGVLVRWLGLLYGVLVHCGVYGVWGGVGLVTIRLRGLGGGWEVEGWGGGGFTAGCGTHVLRLLIGDSIEVGPKIASECKRFWCCKATRYTHVGGVRGGGMSCARYVGGGGLWLWGRGGGGRLGGGVAVGGCVWVLRSGVIVWDAS
ncbi:unnamed protein product [Prunus armeniaca]|uniref:Uncharacterized protein n=1 Tax=Prunus armeniaca TaxID=36596 RepID=A0A6J5WF86_PRUAR|nr:unnamed protein product [Prunus armeniaca]